MAVKTRTPPGEARELLSGLVERVTFHSPDTGFCVIRVQVRGRRDLVTVVGHAAAIAPGEQVQASGTWVNEGPRMKRFQPKDRGRAHPILKRTSHITVVVEE